MDERPFKCALVGSSGGHLLQLIALEPLWRHWDRFWVTFRKTDATSLLNGERTYWASFPTNRNVPNLIRNSGQAIRVLWRERPDLIISTGAGAAIPYFVLGRLFGAKLVYLEVYDRVDSSTVTGRICRPFCHLFAVQWEEQQRLYSGATLVGPVL